MPIQRISRRNRGVIAWLLGMARFGANHDAETLVVAGVKSWAKPAKNYWAQKKPILMPNPRKLTCYWHRLSIDEFFCFFVINTWREVVVYANTSAAVISSRWLVVTSSIALDVSNTTCWAGREDIWAPDQAPSVLYSARNRCGIWFLGWGLHCPMKNLSQRDFRLKKLSTLMLAILCSSLKSASQWCLRLQIV